MNVKSATVGSLQVSEMAGVTLRQLQWWDEQGIIEPEKEGHRRGYDQPTLVWVLLSAELRRKGVGLRMVRKVLEYVRDRRKPSQFSKPTVLVFRDSVMLAEERHAVKVMNAADSGAVLVSLGLLIDKSHAPFQESSCNDLQAGVN